jgi:hypothetical protein
MFKTISAYLDFRYEVMYSHIKNGQICIERDSICRILLRDLFLCFRKSIEFAISF